jgi:hypothetical protein
MNKDMIYRINSKLSDKNFKIGIKYPDDIIVYNLINGKEYSFRGCCGDPEYGNDCQDIENFIDALIMIEVI